MGWSRKTHFKCVQIYHVEEGVLMFLSFWGQHYEQSCKWLSKGGSGGKADTQMVAWWNPGTHSDSAPFKPCSNQSTLQTLFPHLCNDYDTLCPPYVSLLWGHCFFLLGPGMHRVLFVPSKSLFPQFCVGSGGSMVGLMVTSFKGSYAIPRYATPRAPAPAAVHC